MVIIIAVALLIFGRWQWWRRRRSQSDLLVIGSRERWLGIDVVLQVGQLLRCRFPCRLSGNLCGGDMQQQQAGIISFLTICNTTASGDILLGPHFLILPPSLTVHPNAVLHLTQRVLRYATIRAHVLCLEVPYGDRHSGLVVTLRDVLHDLLERGGQDLT